MATYPVKNYLSTQTSAPTLSGTAGAGITLIDTCLLNGFNSKSVSSLTRSSTTATVVTSTDHGFGLGDIVAIAGANESAWNGEWMVASIPQSDTFTFTCVGTETTPATGTITVKYPPLSSYWTKSASGTNTAIYKSSDPAGTQFYLHVDDTNAKHMIVTMIESFIGINTNLVNSSVQYWYKSDTASSAARPWVFVGDSKRFYFLPAWSINASFLNQFVCEPYFFGDILTIKPGDGFHTALHASNTSIFADTQVGNTSFNSFLLVDNNINNAQGAKLLRDYNQMGKQVSFAHYALGGGPLGNNTNITYPNSADNGVFLEKVYVTNNYIIRGFMPGLFAPLQATKWSLTTGDTTVIKSGKTYMYVRSANTNSNIVYGFFLDITGPWTL